VIKIYKPASMTVEKFQRTMANSAIYQDLMGSNGKISIDGLFEFLENLREAILKIEFEYYDNEQRGSISSMDFARILVTYADSKDVSEYTKKVENCPNVGRVTLEQYLQFNEAILQLNRIIRGLGFYFTAESHTSSEVLQRAFFAGANVQLPSFMMEIIMHVFDRDGNGTLEIDELNKVMSKRKKMRKVKWENFDFTEARRCLKECFKST